MHPFRFGIQCRGPADPVGWPALARKVEDLGWSTLTVADHLDDQLAPVAAVMAAAGCHDDPAGRHDGAVPTTTATR